MTIMTIEIDADINLLVNELNEKRISEIEISARDWPKFLLRCECLDPEIDESKLKTGKLGTFQNVQVTTKRGAPFSKFILKLA